MFDPHRELSAGKIAALKLLKGAFDDAEDTGHDTWQFAIRKSALLALGTTVNDLRWLIASHLAEEVYEITRPGDSERRFRGAPPLGLVDGACFVLTHGGNVYVETHILSADGDDQRGEAHIAKRETKRRRRRARKSRAATDSSGGASSSEAPRPVWHSFDGNLFFRGELLRRRGRKAARLEDFLLCAFEKAEWKRALLIALPNDQIETLDQLKEGVRRLNGGMLLDKLRFHAHAHDGGAVVSWEDCDLTSGKVSDEPTW